MRIRQVKPAWWLDKSLRKGLNADQREFYIGLWMLADDAGWLDWDVERVAAELYPYAPVSQRERKVATYGYRLTELQPESPHLVIHPCGHAVVPKMADHQRIAGRLTTTTRDRHLRCSTRSQHSLRVATVGNGRERNGMSATDILKQRDEEDAELAMRLRETLP